MGIALFPFILPKRFTRYYDGGSCVYVSNCTWKHRIDGPSMEDEFGRITFHINNYLYNVTKAYCKDAGMDDETTLLWVMKYGETLPHNIRDF